MPRSQTTLYEKAITKAYDTKVASKALAYFVFREIIEDAHTKYKITQDEMMAMNKKAVNRAAAFLETMEEPELFASLVSLLTLETTGWDNPKKTVDTKRHLELAEESAEALRRVKGKTTAEVFR